MNDPTIEDGQQDCPFCAICAASAPATVVYESPAAMAFFPLHPATLGHTLVIPRAHVPDIWGLEPAEAGPLTEATLRVAHAVRKALRPEGLNLITSAGPAASQTVFHLHIHVVPRWHDDAVVDAWPHPTPPMDAGELDRAARSIREAAAR